MENLNLELPKCYECMWSEHHSRESIYCSLCHKQIATGDICYILEHSEGLLRYFESARIVTETELSAIKDKINFIQLTIQKREYLLNKLKEEQQ